WQSPDSICLLPQQPARYVLGRLTVASDHRDGFGSTIVPPPPGQEWLPRHESVPGIPQNLRRRPPDLSASTPRLGCERKSVQPRNVLQHTGTTPTRADRGSVDEFVGPHGCPHPNMLVVTGHPK